MKLARRCQELLQKAELKVTKLQEEFATLREETEPYVAGEEEETPLE
jgi:exonuclease VII small subunit